MNLERWNLIKLIIIIKNDINILIKQIKFNLFDLTLKLDLKVDLIRNFQKCLNQSNINNLNKVVKEFLNNKFQINN